MRPDPRVDETSDAPSIGGMLATKGRREEHMPRYFCQLCQSETLHGNVLQAAKIAQVTRATIYNWKKKALLHGVVRPSGRSFICINSLLRPQR
jgi:hypothetical protein